MAKWMMPWETASTPKKQPPHPHDGFGGAALIGICPIYLAGCIGFSRHHHGNKPIRFLYIETSACTPKWPNPTVGKLKWFSMPHFAMATGTASPCSGSASCSTSRKSVFSPPQAGCNPSHPINLRRGFCCFLFKIKVSCNRTLHALPESMYSSGRILEGLQSIICKYRFLMIREKKLQEIQILARKKQWFLGLRPCARPDSAASRSACNPWTPKGQILLAKPSKVEISLDLADFRIHAPEDC